MNLRTFMFENVYLAASAKSEHPRIEKMIRVLFEHYVEQPPAPMTPGASEAERIVDWLAGHDRSLRDPGLLRPGGAAGLLMRLHARSRTTA